MFQIKLLSFSRINKYFVGCVVLFLDHRIDLGLLNFDAGKCSGDSCLDSKAPKDREILRAYLCPLNVRVTGFVVDTRSSHVLHRTVSRVHTS